MSVLDLVKQTLICGTSCGWFENKIRNWNEEVFFSVCVEVENFVDSWLRQDVLVCSLFGKDPKHALNLVESQG